MNSNRSAQDTRRLAVAGAKAPGIVEGGDPATGEARGSPERPNSQHPPSTLKLATMERDEAVASMMRWKARKAVLTEQLRITEQQLDFTRRRLEFADNTLACVKKFGARFPLIGIKSQSRQDR